MSISGKLTLPIIYKKKNLPTIPFNIIAYAVTIFLEITVNKRFSHGQAHGNKVVWLIEGRITSAKSSATLTSNLDCRASQRLVGTAISQPTATNASLLYEHALLAVFE